MYPNVLGSPQEKFLMHKYKFTFVGPTVSVCLPSKLRLSSDGIRCIFFFGCGAVEAFLKTQVSRLKDKHFDELENGLMAK